MEEDTGECTRSVDKLVSKRKFDDECCELITERNNGRDENDNQQLQIKLKK